jgi:septal ring factor EnvC (AmiA/AmiB activator)
VQAQDPGLQQQISSLEAKRTKLEQDERSLDAQKRDLMRRIAVHTRDLSATDAENLSKLEARVGQMDATIEKLSDELRRCELGR